MRVALISDGVPDRNQNFLATLLDDLISHEGCSPDLSLGLKAEVEVVSICVDDRELLSCISSH